uniref:E2F/DP family winged-helix DNA-binding domain-containing protein n=1 Tax=Lutzomyia longipalpis TaxID=7200 RepID=A0A1B0CQH0_LUTLO
MRGKTDQYITNYYRQTKRRHTTSAPGPPLKQAKTDKLAESKKRYSEGACSPVCRYDTSLGLLTRKFMELLQTSPDGVVDLNVASDKLKRNLNPLLEGEDGKKKIFDGIEDFSMSVTRPVVTQQEASSMMGTKGNTSVLRATYEVKREDRVSEDSPKKDRTTLKGDVKLSSSPDEGQWSLFNEYNLSPHHLSQV